QKECVLENGSSRIVEITITPYYDENNVYKGIIEILRDITEKVEAEKKLIYIAHYDKLTSLPNKFLFEKELENSLTEMKKIEGELALFFIDLIRFKNINNILGHPSGDKILIEVGQRLKSTFSKSHFISRFGGNVFTIIVAGNNTKEELNTISQLVLDAFSQPFEVNNNKLFINACIGICSYPQDGENVIELMQHAEIALNRAKNEGRNSIQHYSDLTEKYSFQRLKLENELYHSIENKELEVYYQPQVDSNNENLIGFEALCRWKHPVMGEISPGDFIGIAEEIGFIVPLGKFVLKKACEQTKLWMDRFNYPFRISVNISPRQLLVENIVFDVKNILEETGLEPSSLELEITESSIIQNVEHVLKVLHSLKELGIKISVDDFGTGYSSLQYIKSLPIDSFKIDLSFVRGVPDNLADKAVIKTIVSLAKNLNLHTVAEGVENSEQKEFLTTVGCNILQGYYYGKPTPAKEVEISLQNLVKQVSL
ncbi:MAG: EAL domain-containing protein, partial [Leptospiraceae bacterium]|nr:EAL domain-containing protein [Leptospiraceae bacterium]